MSFDTIIEKIKSRGYWRFNFHPKVYTSELLSLGNCLDIVRNNSVSLRGWDYPHVPSRKDESEGFSVADKYYHAWIDWNGYKEYWRMYQSGQFLHFSALHEDWDDENELIRGSTKPRNKGEIIYIDGSMLYQITEVFEFLSRLARASIYDDDIIVSISLHNIENRVLYVGNQSRAPFHNSYKAGTEAIPFSAEYSIEQLIEKPAYCSLEATLFFYDRFAWHKPPIETLKKDQAELLSGLF